MMKRLATVNIATINLLVIALLLIGCPNQAPGDSATAPSSELQELQTGNYISEGEGNMIAYAFTDPHCPACEKLQQRVANGATPNVEWRWLPVGFLGQGARQEAAQKLEENLKIDGQQAEQENRQLAVNLGVRSVPTIFYRHPNGETYRFSGGSRQQLAGLENIAEQYHQAE